MAQVLFANRAYSTLAGGITNVALTLTVQSGDGAKYPSPTGGDYFSLVLGDGTIAGAYEVTYCTSRTGDVLTVTRAQEGTSALAWTAGTRADNLITAGAFSAIQSNASGQTQSGNYATDSGTADALIITISPAIVAYTAGMPIRILKGAAANTGPATLDANGIGATPIVHADGTNVAAGELPANGLFEVNYDGASFVLQTMTHEAATATEVEAGTDTVKQLTPENASYHDGAAKAWAIFHWNGAAVVLTAAHNVSSVSHIATGHYRAQLSGGFNFASGAAVVTGCGPNPATAGSIGMGSSFTGTNPLVDIYTGDAGGSGGQASDPAADVMAMFFGHTSN